MLKIHFTKRNIIKITLLVFGINCLGFFADFLFDATDYRYTIFDYISYINYLFYFPFGYLFKHRSFEIPIVESLPLLFLLLNSLFYAIILILSYTVWKSMINRKISN